MQVAHNQIYTDDFDELGDWEHSHGIETKRKQLTRGPGLYQADFLDLGELIAWRYREPHRMLHEFALPRGSVEICIGRYPDSLIWCGMKIPGSTLTIHFGGESYCSVVPPGGVLYGFVFPEPSCLLRGPIFEEMIARATLKRQATAPVSDQTLDRILRSIDPLFVGKPGSVLPAVAINRILDGCQEAIEECLTSRRREHLPKRRLVDDARDLI